MTQPRHTEGATEATWESLYRRMRNVAAGYSNYCEESGSTRKLEREFDQIEDDARAIALESAPKALADAGGITCGSRGVTDEQIEQIATIAHAEGRLPWAGFKPDVQGFCTVPVISQSHTALVRAVLVALTPPAPNQGAES